MKKNVTAADFLPVRQTLLSLKNAASICHGCPLYKNATQTVFGEGRSNAKLMIVGEIPGNKEDILGKPFQGPAGMLLRQSLEVSGIDMEDAYFTNVVKHFKFKLLNNRRMHRSPVASEIHACLPWLEAQIHVIQPQIILCLGAIAAKTLVNKKFQLRVERGKWVEQSKNLRILVTFHPSAILRTVDKDSRHKMKTLFIKDLKKVTLALYKH
jgi:uracil-DNA glycosylase family protein